MTDIDDDNDFVTRVEAMTAFCKKLQLPLTQFEREALSELYATLNGLIDSDLDASAVCPTCGSTDGFHTEDACLEVS